MIRNVMIRNVMTLVMICNLTHSTYVGLRSTDVVQQDQNVLITGADERAASTSVVLQDLSDLIDLLNLCLHS